MHYNNTKGGVDNADQMIKEYSARRITKRWSMAIFGNFIDICCLNAYICRKSRSHQSRESFLRSLALDLIKPLAIKRIDDTNIKFASSSVKHDIEVVTGQKIKYSAKKPPNTDRGNIFV